MRKFKKAVRAQTGSGTTVEPSNSGEREEVPPRANAVPHAWVRRKKKVFFLFCTEALTLISTALLSSPW